MKHRTALCLLASILVCGWMISRASAGPVTTGPLAKPCDSPQHWLRVDIDYTDTNFPNGKVIERANSDPGVNYYHQDTYHSYMKNEPPPNPVKFVWMYMTFSVPLNAGWNPTDPNMNWVDLAAPGATDSGRSYQYSGSSLQFLELWQRWEIRPNPEYEDFYLNSKPNQFFNVANPLKLTHLEIETQCVAPVPLPAAAWMGGALLSSLLAGRRALARKPF